MARLLIGICTVVAIGASAFVTRDVNVRILIGMAGFLLMVISSIGTTDNDHTDPLPKNITIASRKRRVGGWYRTTFLYLIDSNGNMYQVNQKTFDLYKSLPVYETEDK